MTTDFNLPPPPAEPDNDLKDRADAIRKAVGDGEDTEALNGLMDLCEEYGSQGDRDEALIHKRDYSQLQRELRLPTRSLASIKEDERMLWTNILKLVETIRKNPRG